VRPISHRFDIGLRDSRVNVEYSTVLDSQRKQLSGVVQAFAEALSKIPGQVG